MKIKITRLVGWATVMVGSFVAAKASIGFGKAAKHPNPEMWE